MSNIAIIIPAYNREKTNIRALDSVMNQTYHDYRVIVVDDCSTDGTLKLVEDFAKRHAPDKIFVYPLSENVGVGRALNAGTEMIFNDTWMARLDSDDEYTPHYLETRMAVSEQFPDIELFYGGMVPSNGDYQIPDCSDLSKKISISQTSQGPSLLVRMETFRRLGGFSSKSVCEDFEFMSRAKRAFVNIYKMHTSDYIYYRDTENSLTRKLN